MFPVLAGEQTAVAYDTLVIVYFPSPSCSAFWSALTQLSQLRVILGIFAIIFVVKSCIFIAEL